MVTQLGGCGGGGVGSAGDSENWGASNAGRPLGLARHWMIAARVAAAAAANSPDNECSSIRPFYWELGDRERALAWGSVESSSSSRTYTANTVIPVASASKWLYSAYFVQRVGGALTDEDLKFLTLRSGYTRFLACPQEVTVKACLDVGPNGEFSPGNEELFFYSGGHMQKHAALRGLGSLHAVELADEMRSQLGRDVNLAYSSPQPAGAGVLSPEAYARVLRKLMSGQLLLGSLLGATAVCADPIACPGEARTTSSPEGETWHYSLGHWIEDDPAVGDGSFSSPGLLGFYPWIDSGRSWYGLVARVASGANGSIYCGRAIRKAWLDALRAGPRASS